MTVYVDKAKNGMGRMRMSHMFADTLGELHAIAARLGLRRAWFQNHDTPHYDICQTKKRDALELGAIEIDRRKVVEIIRKWRALKQFEAAGG